jgi:hypothetical protein
MGVIVERAGDQHVEARFGGFAGGQNQVHAGERAEFRADQDSGAALGLAFQEASLGADVVAGPGLQADEVNAVRLAGLVHTGCAQMVQHHGGEIDQRRGGCAALAGCRRFPE